MPKKCKRLDYVLPFFRGGAGGGGGAVISTNKYGDRERNKYYQKCIHWIMYYHVPRTGLCTTYTWVKALSGPQAGTCSSERNNAIRQD
jgi:hypothetical protein